MSDFQKRRIIMVDCQVRPSDVTKFPIINAMLEVPREDFVPDSRREMAYVGDHLDIGSGRVLLDPRVLAKMLDALDIRPHDLVLDVGCGMGYSSAVISKMAEAVIALEENKEFSDRAEAAFSLHSVDNAVVVNGRLTKGSPRHGPYDAIAIQGGLEKFPDELGRQLAEGGRVGCIFCEGPVGECRIGIKRGGRIMWRTSFNADAPVLPGFLGKREFVF